MLHSSVAVNKQFHLIKERTWELPRSWRGGLWFGRHLLGLLGLAMLLPAIGQAQFSFTTNNGAIAITGYASTNAVAIIPDAINGYPVTTIGNVAFYNCASLNSLSIPNSVTSIGFAAFDGCVGLTNIFIGNNVTNIVSFPFYDCPNLTGIYFLGNRPSTHYGVLPPGHATVYFLPGTSGWGSSFGSLATSLWLPQIQATDVRFGVQENQFGFKITWASGQAVAVEACTTLSNPDWQPLQTNMLTTGTAYFSDPQWTNYPGRFYRLRSP